MALTDGVLIGLGNPLLDMQAVVDAAYLQKWGLKSNDAILAEDKHVPMFEELAKRPDVEYVPGGATQNSCRIAQFIWQRPNTAVFLGCVGDDEYGKILAEKARAAGVNVQYQLNGDVKTGTCAALIHGEDRSLAAHLAAANHFTIDHLHKPEIQKLIENAKMYYVAGFHLTVCPEAILTLADHALKHNKTMAMNLAAPFICQVPVFKEAFDKCMPFVDILFGNETEAAAWAESHNYGTTDVAEIALKLAAIEKKDLARPRLVIITQGEGPVIRAYKGETQSYPVHHFAPAEIHDTNGAGDAFVGGFLSQLALGAATDDCIQCGIWAASECLTQSGCTMPKGAKYAK